MLHVAAADRLPPLAAGLARVLAEAPVDPFTPEWVAVPAEGMRRWLALELARHLGAGPQGGDGVAANLTSAFPGALRSQVLAAGRVAAGVDPDADPWTVERLVWPLLEVLATAGADPRLARFAEGEGDGPARVSRYGRARRLADLFDRYQVHRPALIRSWADGEDVDGLGRPLTPSQRWQPHLWRRVRTLVGTPSPAEELPDLLARLRDGRLALPELPPRLVLFGLSVLPGGSGFTEVATAVAAQRDLHLFLLDPSPATTAAVRAQLAGAERPVARSRQADRTAELVGHPLLRSWGRLSRELSVLLADAEAAGVPAATVLDEDPAVGPRAAAVAPVAAEGPSGPTTLLAALQADLRSGAAPTGTFVPGADDRSVQLHAAHGPARQVEVLRDAILHLLAADATLREDDIVVASPALERFAPLIETGFGAPVGTARVHAHAHAPALRHRLADRSLRSTNPLVDGVAAVVELAGGRFEGPAVLDLAARPAVRERFGFDEADLTRLSSWVADAHIRWGLDPEHRAGFGVPASITANTWQAALDRLLLGAAVADDEPGFTIGEVVPLGIEGDDVDLAGRLAELVGHLAELARAVDEDRPLAAWVEVLAATAGAVVAPVRGDEWQRDALDRVLGELVAQAGPRATDPELPLTFADLRRVLADHLAGTPGRPDFFRGGITITSTDALRWVPHRVVCLLGMDQQAFAPGAVDGDDLAAAAPLVGDRDARAEGRQAVLEAVLAAGDHLVVVRDGHDVRTNQEIPPAVVVAELAEALLATVAPGSLAATAGDPRRPGGFPEVHHPRQAFDERNLRPGAVGSVAGDGPWSFDPSARTGALARRTRSREATPFLAEPLAAAPATVVELADLHAVLNKPVKVFLDQRLQVRLPREEDALVSRLPVTVQALDEWKVADRLLRAALDGDDLDERIRIEAATGSLPPGVLRGAKVEAITDWIGQLSAAAADLGLRPGPAEPQPVDVVLPDGTRVVGTVGLRLAGDGPGPARVGYSRHKPTHLLDAWLDLLVLVAADPARPWRSVAVNRQPKQGTKVVTNVLVVPGDSDAERRARALDGLAVVVDLLHRARTEPLPLFPRLSHALHHRQATRSLWTRSSDDRPPGDRDEPSAEVAWGAYDHDEVLALPALPHDPPGSGGRVARHAAHLWDAVARTSTDHGTASPAPASRSSATASPASGTAGNAVPAVTAAGGRR